MRLESFAAPVLIAAAALPAPSRVPWPPNLTIALAPVTESKVRGQATFTDYVGGIRIVVSLNGIFIPETEYLAQIRTGHCLESEGEVVHKLRAVQLGTSRTFIAHESTDALELTPHSVRVIDARDKRLLWCGNIVRPGIGAMRR
jgi:hypothetical protein